MKVWVILILTTVNVSSLQLNTEMIQKRIKHFLFRTTPASVMTAISIQGSLLFHNPHIAFAASSDNNKIFNEVWSIVDENFFDDTYNNHDWKKIKDDYNYKIKLPGADDHASTLNALNLLGDKYTRLVDKEKYESLWKFDAIGIGLLLQSDATKSSMIVPADPLPGSSGQQAGMKKDDVILSINGVSMKGKTALDVLEMMSNDEGDNVVIEYTRPSSPSPSVLASTSASTPVATPSDVQKVTLKRSREKVINPVTYSYQTVKLSPSSSAETQIVGYIKLSEFNSEAVHGIEQALAVLNNLPPTSTSSTDASNGNSNNNNKKGVDELILDLRGNLGGGFQFALNIGGMFMDSVGDNSDSNTGGRSAGIGSVSNSGNIMVTALGRGNEKNVFKTAYTPGVLYDTRTKPLILLTDGLSASASEVLASGLHDNCRAVLIGSKTYGKGKIQAVFGLSNGEGMIMTVAQYVSPKGTIIQDRGIQPDIKLDNMINPYISVLLPSAVTESALLKPDLTKFDYQKVKEVLSMCTVPSAETITNAAAAISTPAISKINST